MDLWESIEELSFYRPRRGLAKAWDALDRPASFPARPWAVLASCHRRTGDLTGAHRWWLRARRSSAGDSLAQADLALRRVAILDDLARRVEAERLARLALDVFADAESPRRYLDLPTLAHVVAQRGRTAEAADLLEQAWPHVPRDGRRHHLSLVANLALCRARLGDTEELDRLLDDAAAVLAGAESGVIGRFDWLAAEALFATGDVEAAAERLGLASDRMAADGLYPDAALAAIDLMEVRLRQGCGQGVHRASGRVFSALTRIDDRPLEAALKSLLEDVARRAVTLDGLDATRREIRSHL
ncbi:MAG: hypothetical protein AAGD06_23960 [Acidobacteriota bacterium]